MVRNTVFPRLYGGLGGQGDLSRVQDNVNSVIQPALESLNKTPITGAPPPPWIKPTLMNGWAQAPGLAVVAFHKDALGYVHIKGSAKNGTGGALTIADPVFVLPLGYRPLEFNVFAIAGDAVGPSVAVVANDGFVRSGAASGDDVHISVIFLAEA